MKIHPSSLTDNVLEETYDIDTFLHNVQFIY
jgi:hypothetical protein